MRLILDVDDEPEQRPPRRLGPCALLSAEDMRNDGMLPGALFRVGCETAPEGCVVVESWPSRLVSPGSVRLTDGAPPGWKNGDVLELKKVQCAPRSASEVVVEGIVEDGATLETLVMESAWVRLEVGWRRVLEVVGDCGRHNCCRTLGSRWRGKLVDGLEKSGEDWGHEESLLVRAFWRPLRMLVPCLNRGGRAVLVGDEASGVDLVVRLGTMFVQRQLRRVHVSRIKGDDMSAVLRAVRGCVVLLEGIEDDERSALAFEKAVDSPLIGHILDTSICPSFPGIRIELTALSETERSDLLQSLGGPSFASLAKDTAGFSVQDLIKGVDYALEDGEVDGARAMAKVGGSLVGMGTVQIPRVSWDEIGGMEKEKEAVREAVELPLKRPELFRELGVQAPRGALLFGPPGCAKTLLARALASSAKLAFLSVKGSEVLSMYLGDSEKAVASIFARARAAAPALVFLDEVDALAPIRGASQSPARDRVVNQLLAELDGFASLSQSVAVLAATNRPDLIDPALLRPGRLDRLILVGPPDANSRIQILDNALEHIPHSISRDELVAFTEEHTRGFSGAETAACVRRAAVLAIREASGDKPPHDGLEPILSISHLEQAAKAITPQISPKLMTTYHSFLESRQN